MRLPFLSIGGLSLLSVFVACSATIEAGSVADGAGPPGAGPPPSTDDGGTRPDAPPVATCTADTEKDPANCGACGHDCRGGACAKGLCQAVTVTLPDAPCPETGPCGVAVYGASASGNTIAYIGNTTKSYVLATDFHGSKARIVAEADSGTDRWSLLSFDGINVLFTVDRSTTGKDETAFFRVPISGGKPELLVTVAKRWFSPQVVLGNAYWEVDSCGHLQSLSLKAGSQPKTVNAGGCNTTTYTPSPVFDAKATQAWVGFGATDLARVDLTTGAMKVVAEGLDPRPLALVVTSKELAWVEGDDCGSLLSASWSCKRTHVRAVPLAGGPSVEVATIDGAFSYGAHLFVGDDTSFFVTCGDELCEVVRATGAVRKRAKAPSVGEEFTSANVADGAVDLWSRYTFTRLVR